MTPKPVDTLTELAFPLRGLHEGGEFQEQPNGTTAEAFNVRCRDLNTRDRGGTRPGLVAYIGLPVAEVGELIQLLDTVVTTGLAYLTGNYTVPYERINVDYILDPSDGLRNPGWVIPIGGTGIQPNRNLPNQEDQPENDPPFIPGQVEAAGVSYTVSVLPLGTRTVANLGPQPVEEGRSVIVLRVGEDFYMQGGP